MCRWRRSALICSIESGSRDKSLKVFKLAIRGSSSSRVLPFSQPDASPSMMPASWRIFSSELVRGRRSRLATACCSATVALFSEPFCRPPCFGEPFGTHRRPQLGRGRGVLVRQAQLHDLAFERVLNRLAQRPLVLPAAQHAQRPLRRL